MAAQATTTNTTTAPGGTSVNEQENEDVHTYVATTVVPPSVVRQIRRDLQRETMSGAIVWVMLIVFSCSCVSNTWTLFS